MIRRLHPSPVRFDTATKILSKVIVGNDLALATNGVIGWQNPEDTPIIITRVLLDITTATSGACTLDIGYTATSAVTTSDTFLDGIDANAIALHDSGNAALDSQANTLAQKAAVGSWVTVDEKTGDAEGMIATLYVEYFPVVQ